MLCIMRIPEDLAKEKVQTQFTDEENKWTNLAAEVLHIFEVLQVDNREIAMREFDNKIDFSVKESANGQSFHVSSSQFSEPVAEALNEVNSDIGKADVKGVLKILRKFCDITKIHERITLITLK